MKSFLAVLPLVALALAHDQCGPQRTVTKTEVQKVTVTVQPTTSSPSAVAAEASSSAVVTPSHQPSDKPHFPHYPFPNGTFSHRFPTGTFAHHRPTTLSTYVKPSSSAPSSASDSAESTVTLILSPSPVNPTETGTGAAVPSSSETAAAPSTTSTAAAASSSTSAAAEAAATSSAGSGSANAAVTGTATFYGGNLAGGACSFSGYTIPSGLFGTAFGGNWDASECGACVSVTGPNGNSIKAMVVDQCPECTSSHLDLFQNAFSTLADPSKGVIDISYTIVPCGIESPIILKNKEGTSKYWFSMQVMNSNVAVSKLEVSTDGGATWKATNRQSYNFFENSSGFGTDTVDVKVTSVGGQTIVVSGVSVASSTTKTASSNFSA